VSFQPSEFAKIGFICVTAVWLDRMDRTASFWRDLLILLGLSLAPIVLVLLEPDAGTALVYLFAYVVMLFVYGIKYRYFIGSLGLLAAVSPLIYFFLLRDFQRARILALFFPGSDSLGTTYQIDNALMAIGSGGWFGKGLYHGVLTQSGAIPVRESDFIFAVIGEEMGFVGALVFIVLLAGLVILAMSVSRRAPDRIGKLIAAGIAAMFAFDFIINIGMCVGLLPVSGLPLPFVSYGGTAMVSNLVAVGFLFSISLRRKRSIFQS
jgi:rod shape determining protein RodA